MKLPEIPLPEPLVVVEVPGGSRGAQAMASALRFLLWSVPCWSAELLCTDVSRSPGWVTLTVAFGVLAWAMTFVRVTVLDADEEDSL